MPLLMDARNRGYEERLRRARNRQSRVTIWLTPDADRKVVHGRVHAVAMTGAFCEVRADGDASDDPLLHIPLTAIERLEVRR